MIKFIEYFSVDHALAGGFAFLMAYLREMLSGVKVSIWQRLAEASTCAGFAYVAGNLADANGLDQGYTYAAAGLIGSIGSQSIRMMVLKFAEKKLEIKEPKDKGSVDKKAG